MLLPILILLIIDLIILTNTPRKIASPKSEEKTKDDGEWTVFGTMGGGWTRKQLEYLEKSGKSYTFIDCDKEECADMEAFPTLVHSNGERHVGFKEV